MLAVACAAGQYERLSSAAKRSRTKQLQAALVAGVGFHNAAMEASDRCLVEELFLAQDLPVLCTTSTLATGGWVGGHEILFVYGIELTKTAVGAVHHQHAGHGWLGLWAVNKLCFYDKIALTLRLTSILTRTIVA